MLDISSKTTTPTPKCNFTHTLLPPYIDAAHPPSKKQPFTTISSQNFTQTLDLVLPAEIYTLIADQLRSTAVLKYARVYMPLSAILSPEVLGYIKTGNVMMVSEGRRGVDEVFWLGNGVLRMELGRDVYERCGLQGVPVEDGGSKHKKARFLVEVDLREKCMVGGKKGFGRLVRAAEEVLGKSKAWLVCDVGKDGEGMGVVDGYAPVWKTVGAHVVCLDGIAVPELKGDLVGGLDDQDTSLELLEWLHLVCIDSPRVRDGDRIDEFLSRYRVPDFTNGESDDISISRNLVRLRWRGFITPAFVRDVFLLLRRNGIGGAKEGELDLGGKWFAMVANAFAGFGGCYTVLQSVGRDTWVWECD